MVSFAALIFESCLAVLRAAMPSAKLLAMREAIRPARENEEANPGFLPLALPELLHADEPPEPPDGWPQKYHRTGIFPAAKSSTGT